MRLVQDCFSTTVTEKECFEPIVSSIVCSARGIGDVSLSRSVSDLQPENEFRPTANFERRCCLLGTYQGKHRFFCLPLVTDVRCFSHIYLKSVVMNSKEALLAAEIDYSPCPGCCLYFPVRGQI